MRVCGQVDVRGDDPDGMAAGDSAGVHYRGGHLTPGMGKGWAAGGQGLGAGVGGCRCGGRRGHLGRGLGNGWERGLALGGMGVAEQVRGQVWARRSDGDRGWVGKGGGQVWARGKT